MPKSPNTKWLFIACGLQFALIGAMFISAYLPIAFGAEVRVIAKGYDPRDLLAGNYVRLDYGVKIPRNFHSKDSQKEVFACLKEVEPNLFVFEAVLSKLPKNRLCVKTKLPRRYDTILEVKEIDRYFAPEKEAQKIQKLLSKPDMRAIVTLKIFQGKARIVDLEVESIKKLPLDNLEEILSNDKIQAIELPPQQER